MSGLEKSTLLNDKQLIDSMDDLRKKHDLSHSQLAKIIDLDPKDYADLIFFKKGLTSKNLEQLCNEFDIALDELKNLSGPSRTLDLPVKYQNERCKTSRTRSLATVYQGLSWYRSERFAAQVFKAFNLDQKMLKDPEGFVNLDLALDILEYLRKQGFSDFQLKRIGTSSVQANRKSALATKLQNYTSPQETYRAMHEELMSHFDHTWEYKLTSINDNECFIEIKTREQTQELYRQKVVGSREMCLCRQGIYESILFHNHKRFAKLKELKCCYLDGGDLCVYHLSW